jgi:CRP/FNR family transcriptional regulator
MIEGHDIPVVDTDTPSVCLPDDGDAMRFCSACAFSEACLSVGYGKAELYQLHCLVEHVGPIRGGAYAFRMGDPFRAIYAVRSGMVKTCAFDAEGREQVLGFHLPGEVVGLNGIYPDRLPCDAVALESTQFCRFSFSAMSALAARLPALQQHLFRLLSKELGTTAQLAADHSSGERVAMFLLDLGDRYAARGFSGEQFRLSMSRSDIANYLRLAPETVSRVLGRLRGQGVIDIDGRMVVLRDRMALRALALGIASC